MRPQCRKLPEVVALGITDVCGPCVFALAALPDLAIAARAALVLALALLRVLAPFCWVVLGRKCDTLDAGQAARAKPVPFWAPCPSSLTSSGDMEVVLFFGNLFVSLRYITLSWTAKTETKAKRDETKRKFVNSLVR